MTVNACMALKKINIIFHSSEGEGNLKNWKNKKSGWKYGAGAGLLKRGMREGGDGGWGAGTFSI